MRSVEARTGAGVADRQRWGRGVLGALSLLLCLAGPADVVEHGYFADTDVQPLRGASMDVFAVEPAAVVVFSTGAGGIEAAAKFDAWAGQGHLYEFPRFGVVIGSSVETVDIVEEVLSQKGIKMPVFYTRAKLLHGPEFRILVLDRGEALDHQGEDLGALETKMNALAEAAKTAPASAGPVETAASTEATPTPSSTQKLEYVNTRYRFVVEFPPGWSYQAARNGDGAVGKPPTTSTLDVRVWAIPRSQAQDSGGDVGVPDFLIAHLERLGKRAGSEVSIERKFIVREGGYEGRDYVYSYPVSEPGEEGARRRVRRGRIQAFEADGVYKVANAEGEASEYERNKSAVDGFLESFSVAPD